jgi:hypothetical protein
VFLYREAEKQRKTSDKKNM